MLILKIIYWHYAEWQSAYDIPNVMLKKMYSRYEWFEWKWQNLIIIDDLMRESDGKVKICLLQSAIIKYNCIFHN